MSVFSGPQHKGAMRQHRDNRYRRAVGRQLECIKAGGLVPHGKPVELNGSFGAFWFAKPAPIERFLRAGDTVDTCDWHSYARATAASRTRGGVDR